VRKSFVAILVLLVMANALSQGTVTFSNSGAPPVICSDGTRIPVGSTFQAELMFVEDGTPGAEFDLVAVRVGNPANFVPVEGYFNGGTRTVATIEPGQFGLFQVRVWETAYGGSYNAVVASGQGGVGKSSIIRVRAEGYPETPASLAGWGLDQIVVSGSRVPEPSIMILGLVASAILLSFLRRANPGSRNPR
jgi:hypothetical protein